MRILAPNGVQVNVSDEKAERLLAMGGYIEGVDQEDEADLDSLELEDMTVKQLKQFASNHDIDISGLNRKDDLIEALSE